jgi:hypothetical protein
MVKVSGLYNHHFAVININLNSFLILNLSAGGTPGRANNDPLVRVRLLNVADKANSSFLTNKYFCSFMTGAAPNAMMSKSLSS